MEELLSDPPMPYVGRILGGRFTPRATIKIQGVAPVTAYIFNINLQCGPETRPTNDIGMRISVRLLDGYMSFNSLQRGSWDEEQCYATLPIKQAQKFEIILKCCVGQYQVVINGQHFCDFPQRIPYDRITHLAIDGDVSIIQILYTSALEHEIRAPPLQIQNEIDNFEMSNANNSITPPPSYETTVQSNGIGFIPGEAAGSPYPTNAPFSTNASCPTNTAYPTSAYPTSTPYFPTTTPYPTQGNVTALNANTTTQPLYSCGTSLPPTCQPSTFRPPRTSKCKKWATIVGLITVGIILAIISGFLKKDKSNQHH